MIRPTDVNRKSDKKLIRDDSDLILLNFQSFYPIKLIKQIHVQYIMLRTQ